MMATDGSSSTRNPFVGEHGMKPKLDHVLDRKSETGETPAVEPVTVVSISPSEEDHVSLRRIVSQAEGSGYSALRCEIHPRFGLESALPALRKGRIPILLCERALLSGTWKQVLAETINLPDPPLLIVTSRAADERLWSEVLNLGAWDLLAKPFHAEEVLRVLNTAWLHWKSKGDIHRNRHMQVKMAAAAG
jgi:DNA-binding response OmpR family regulator